jgi:predicted small metal-binding protein
MTLSVNCKEAGDPKCEHTVTGENEQELMENGKKHAIEVHGMTAEEVDKYFRENEGKFRSLIKHI